MAPPPGAAPRRRIDAREILERLREDGAVDGVVVLGGGCAGLALGLAVAERGGSVAVVESRTGDRDGRTWCYWEVGAALVPEAVSRSWDAWEIRTTAGVARASDCAHPYRMVRAHDYRAAARRRIAGSPDGRLLDGLQVVGSIPPDRAGGSSDEPLLVDARGALPPGPVPQGRVRLHQRFAGQWIRTIRPVFDDSTVTLMDFPAARRGEDVRFFYVLPVAPDLALVECTVLARSARGPLPFRADIAAYLHDRWSLQAGEWTVEGEEAGSIPMTDARSEPNGSGGRSFGLRAGIARPSTGYAFTRIQLAARRAASAIRAEEPLPSARDPWRTRALDAIFLRVLRDRPHAAPDAFLRMFDRLPGPLVVRFLTERSTLLDELRLILALPKAPFLLAAATVLRERLGAVLR